MDCPTPLATRLAGQTSTVRTDYDPRQPPQVENGTWKTLSSKFRDVMAPDVQTQQTIGTNSTKKHISNRLPAPQLPGTSWQPTLHVTSHAIPRLPTTLPPIATYLHTTSFDPNLTSCQLPPLHSMVSRRSLAASKPQQQPPMKRRRFVKPVPKLQVPSINTFTASELETHLVNLKQALQLVRKAAPDIVKKHPNTRQLTNNIIVNLQLLVESVAALRDERAAKPMTTHKPPRGYNSDRQLFPVQQYE